MDLQEYLARMNSGEPVEGGGEMHRFMREINEVTMRLTCELNAKYHTGEEIREIFSKIIGKPVDKSFRLFPPFYTNCGKNTTVGKGVFINTGCHFQDQGGITLGDGTFLGNNVVLTTMNHDFDPEKRSTTYPAPIVTGKNVWIGSSVTVVPGVHIGDGAIIAAHSVVTKDVGPYQVVGGNPARFLKKRFDDALIALLLQVRWWDFPPEKLVEVLPLLCDPDLDFVRAQLQQMLEQRP